MSSIEVDNSVEAILISPNLGQPLILEIDRKLKNKDFQTSLLYVCSDTDPEKIKQAITSTLSLIPLFDYKWSYKLIPKVKKKGFWARWKEKRAKKKKKKEDKVIEEQEVKLESKIDILKRLKARLHRAHPIHLNIINIEQISINSISNVSYIDAPGPQEYLVKNHIFGNLSSFYKITIEFTLSKEVIQYLEERQFLMFDIMNSNSRINYHSIVISKQKWKNFTFIHATDLHLAERNDRIYGIVKKWTHSSVKEGVDDFFKAVKKKLKLLLFMKMKLLWLFWI